MVEISDFKFKWWVRDLLELGILMAIVIFILVIYIPRAIWDEEETIRTESRFRMENDYDVLTYYERLTDQQTENGLWALKVVNATRDSLTADSTFLGQQTIHLGDESIDVDVFEGYDVVYDTSFGFLMTRKDTIVDTVYTVVTYNQEDARYDTSFIRLDMIDPYLKDTTLVDIPDTNLSSHVEVVSYYDSYMPDSTMFFCSLTEKPYIITISEDDMLTVQSPITETYKEQRYLVFSFKSNSHGKIEDGDKSWDRF
ncbi:MAG: hypothetical protein QF613_08150 [Candidatus Marinimicrobia bacterium]|jgi:hypothetical protein|nr:hypothetical protein [Candidatus Neomarinimicrobiota bacterium]MDP6594155.1 hypothetical protein [Candidatus Neomarinimicrobiota bacterium]MDP6835633.1 hypothetical protein [Candidatus Neomarinimicrobiota bacterium]MDP6966868.1 hypothetical protein [Candidatus Neomarinimicrobiota bacterium]|tara:strand:+ start:10423 stop:11187 length:765 start_codon:yes stop_codon:yes gene_type:complete